MIDEPRAIPHSYPAEMALLGAALMDPRAVLRARDFLLPEHFADPLLGRIYGTILTMLTQGRAVDANTVAVAMAGDHDLKALGGHGYLGRLIGAATTIINANDYAMTIYEAHLRRELMVFGEDTIREASKPGGASSGEMIGILQDALEVIGRQHDEASGKPRRGLLAPKVYLEAAMRIARESQFRQPGEVPGISTGLIDLDRRMGGMLPGDLIIFAGRPGMGKSSLLQTIAYNAARRAFADGTRQCVAMFSPEMAAGQIGSRLLAYDTDISQMAQRVGPLDSAQVRRLENQAKALEAMPLWIDDSPIRFIDQMAQRCREFARKEPLSLIGLDYIQLVGGNRSNGRQENRAVELGLVSTALKNLAKEMACPVIALSQLSRGVEGRDDKRPILSDLRDSGGLEQDADVIGFIYRQWYYLNQSEPKRGPNEDSEKFANRVTNHESLMTETKNTAEVIFAKTRHGPTGVTKLAFDPARQHFGLLASEGTDEMQMR